MSILLVSHVEICEQIGQDGQPTRMIKILEIFDDHNQSTSEEKQPIEPPITSPAKSVGGPNHFDRLPDELLERIINFSALSNSTSAAISMDPYEAGWKDEEELIQDALSFGHSMATLRLVCWRFFQLATPLFLKRLVISDSSWGERSHRRPLELMIPRLSRFLSATTAYDNHSLIEARVGDEERRAMIGQARRKKRAVDQVPYGHHVRQLILSNRTVPPSLICRLLETVHPLLPNLTALAGLSLSHMPRLLSPTIRFPRLVSLTGFDLAGSSELWRPGYQSDYPLDSPATPTLMIAGPGPNHQLISLEVFLGFLNHHPLISYLSCRGLLIDQDGASRLLALLRINHLSTLLMTPAVPRLCNLQFSGLRMLHIGLNSVIDLQLLRSLPEAAPHLEQLHIDAGCKLEDKSTAGSQSWSISQLLGKLPRLTDLSFIAQHNLPSRPHRSLGWACSNQVLMVAPQVQSLNLRMDSFTTAEFFESLTIDGPSALRQLNVWHRPTLSLTPASESWSIISFGSPQVLRKLGHAVRTMKKAGLEWPTIDNHQRDLWLKLKSLTHLDLFEEPMDDSSDVDDL
ncbi:hypothetical protein PGTUg99_034804 [Puccinia graminis f. sp. tritici]|uniref:F-box domain-containing protein n=1 Tax=Puccinia graminis f. sp. tritici TaxID=56615 RepID=A0A5B0R7U0_PUCGR|nr:hypothetical protein PGTUg99_034804 [Puccinia graminis f. sp. tritici]